MRNKKKIVAMILAGIMMLSMGTSVLADGPTVDTDGTVSVTKEFQMAEGIDTPNTTFNFKATPITEGAPTAVINSISFDKDQGNLENGILTVTKTSEIIFTDDFPHAGEYVYTVVEVEETTVPGVEYCTDTSKLHVYVKNTDDGGLAIRNMTAEKISERATSGTKVDKIKFVNTFRTDANLSITNHTEGEVADKTEDFSFTITITSSKTEADPNATYEGMIGAEPVTVQAGTPTEFFLCDGETLKFASLPAGTRYVVEEKAEIDGYTPSVQVTENGWKNPPINAADEKSGVSSAVDGQTNLVGERDNSVVFTNTYKGVPATGIIMNNLPFIIVIVVAVLALGTLAILKKQKLGRR